MGKSLSAAKRIRQSEKRRMENKANRRVLAKELKTFDTAVAGGKADAKTAFAQVQKALDRAARKNAIPKGRANRKKARLARKLAKAAAAK
ncbi:MAG: 30S ribosomal protein S20 [Planctomycetes bacterium]|nr:30S ribosomal protein S20 [Planctomycetota bacterium]